MQEVKMINESIPDGLLRASMSLICPLCQKSHKITVGSDGKILECAQCKQKIKIPSDLTIHNNRLDQLSLFEETSNQLNALQKLVIEQELEIKALKSKGSYEGLLPRNAKGILEIVEQVKIKLEESLDDIYSLTEINPEEANKTKSNHDDT